MAHLNCVLSRLVLYQKQQGIVVLLLLFFQVDCVVKRVELVVSVLEVAHLSNKPLARLVHHIGANAAALSILKSAHHGAWRRPGQPRRQRLLDRSRRWGYARRSDWVSILLAVRYEKHLFIRWGAARRFQLSKLNLCNGELLSIDPMA